MPTESTLGQPGAGRAVKQSPFRFVIPILLVLVVGAALFLLATRVFHIALPFGGPASPQNVELTYWGLWEPEGVMQTLIKEYEAAHPGVTIKYAQQKSTDYRERLQTALTEGNGPDLFRYHQTWVPMLKNDLSSVPDDVYTEADFESLFYPSLVTSLKTSRGLVGVPLMTDGLGLYYNKRLLTAAGQTVPESWDELRRVAKQLTVSPNGVIQRAGVALGTTGNVEHWSDVLAVMLLQNAANLQKPNNKLGQDALEFYTIFSRVDNVWDETMPASTFAFASEKVAMMIAPSWRAHDVLTINPNLEFAIAPLPQLPDTHITWSTAWVEGVSAKTSKAKQKAAWEFLKHLSQKETMRQWYAGISGSARRFGEPFSRIDMAEQLTSDPLVGAYVLSAPTAQSWYLSSWTHDNGLNDAIIKYYEDAVNAVNRGEAPSQALDTVEQGVAQVFQKYNLR